MAYDPKAAPLLVDCEYACTDNGLTPWAMARLNPMHWSGSLTFDQGIEKLEAELKKKDHPIAIKVPSGVLAKENLFPTIREAVDFLKKMLSNAEEAAAGFAAEYPKLVEGVKKAKAALEAAQKANDEAVALEEEARKNKEGSAKKVEEAKAALATL